MHVQSKNVPQSHCLWIQSKIKVVLNKADVCDQQQLMQVRLT